jgi:hypothetical protein
MASVADVLRVAQSQVGYEEGGGSSGHNGNITKYWKELELDLQGQSWCAAFVSWVFKHAGAPLPAIDHKWGYSFCPDAVSWAKKHGVWDGDGRYRPGDIIFFNWTGGSSAEHTGIVVSDDGKTVVTIEGNTSPEGGSGSQANGGGVYLRRRAHGKTILGVLAASEWLHPEAAQKSVPAPAPKPAPKPAPVSRPMPMLRQGARGPFVMKVQAHLGLTQDGAFGPKTKAAVEAFQHAHHLTADGVVGPLTWRALGY